MGLKMLTKDLIIEFQSGVLVPVATSSVVVLNTSNTASDSRQMELLKDLINKAKKQDKETVPLDLLEDIVNLRVSTLPKKLPEDSKKQVQVKEVEKIVRINEGGKKSSACTVM